MRIVRCLIATTLLFPLSATVAVPAFGAPAKSATKAKVITRSEIVAMLKRSDQASNDKDVDALCAQMAPDFVANITIEGQPPLTLNLAQYRAVTAQGFAATRNYKYTRTATRVNIAADGQSARVTATVQEQMTLNGTPLRGISRQTTILRIRGGRVLATSITGVARIVVGEATKAA
jgi:hypothetical protein